MAVHTETGITANEISALLRTAREERDQMIWVGMSVAFLTGCAGALACLGAAEIYHRRYESQYRRVRHDIEQRLRQTAP